VSKHWKGIVDLVAALPLGRWTRSSGGRYFWEFHCEIDGLRVVLAENDGEYSCDRLFKVRDTVTGEESVYVGGWDWVFAERIPRRMLAVLRRLIDREEAGSARDEDRRTLSLLRKMGTAMGVPR
jgi:hypothetical protein